MTKQYDLVFEGGGAKGVVFIGALQAFEAQGYQIGRLLGTSAGAITATLLAAGYNAAGLAATLQETADGVAAYTRFLSPPGELGNVETLVKTTRRYLNNLDIPAVPDFVERKVDDWLTETFINQPLGRHVVSFLELGGWYSAQGFLDWLINKLDTGEYKGQPRRFSGLTLQQFYQTTQVELSLVASNTTDNSMLVLNHRTAPDCPMIWAVRMSMSVPFLWPEVRWKSDWGLYRKRKITNHTIVDGGMLSNFPIELFLAETPFVTEVMGHPSENVLGLLIDETLPVPNAPPMPQNSMLTQFSQIPAVRRALNFLETMTQAYDNRAIETYREHVVLLPAKGYTTTEFDMSPDRQNALVAAGRAAMQAYFAQQTEAVSFGLPTTDPAEKIAATMLR